MTIWVNEQFVPGGLLYSCIAYCDEAQECHQAFEDNLTAEQKAAGWTAKIRQVSSWDEVPVNALKLD